MIERGKERRNAPTPGDRRKQQDLPAQLDWSDALPISPGAIRPGVGETAPRVERRRVPGSGEE